MECVSRFLRRTPPPRAALERSEYARRDKDMLWYLLRGSIWETYTRFVQRLLLSELFDQMFLLIDRSWNHLSLKQHIRLC